jgi:fatty acid desaturase
MAYEYPRKERMQAVRALSTAVFIMLAFGAFGVLLFLTSFEMWRLVASLIVGALVALPFALKFHRLTKDRLDASR